MCYTDNMFKKKKDKKTNKRIEIDGAHVKESKKNKTNQHNL